MNNAIYFPGGVRYFNGNPTARVWQVARRLSVLHGHCHVVTDDKVVQYKSGMRQKKKLDIKRFPA